jgi:hypothetical protein
VKKELKKRGIGVAAENQDDSSSSSSSRLEEWNWKMEELDMMERWAEICCLRTNVAERFWGRNLLEPAGAEEKCHPFFGME